MFSSLPTLSFTSQLLPVSLKLVWHHRSKITRKTLEKPPAKALSVLSCGKGLLPVFCRQPCVYTLSMLFVFFCNIMTPLTHVQIMLQYNPRSLLPRKHYPSHIWKNCNCCLRNEPLTHSYWRPSYFFQIISLSCRNHTKQSSCLPAFTVTPSLVSSAN